MSLDAVPDFLRPRLRLFMSVDLVGSTALKQSGEFPLKKPQENESLGDSGAKWLFEIATFYRDMQSKFAYSWDSYCKNIAPQSNWPVTDAPRLWKANGDELIFVAEISSSRQCVAMVACWLSACKEFRNDLGKKKAKLDVKMSAWTAGFPLTNTEVIFSQDQRHQRDDWQPEVLHYYLIEAWHDHPGQRAGLNQDFIGPGLDTGFRISGKATARKFMICLELAFIISSIIAPPGMDAIDICYDGQEALKGVLGSKPYPMFWIDTHKDDALSKCEDSLTSQSALDHAKVRRYCESFLEKHDSYLLRPFIHGDSEPLLAKIPQNYVERINSLKDAWLRAKSSREVYLKSLENDDSQEISAEEGVIAQEPKIEIPMQVPKVELF